MGQHTDGARAVVLQARPSRSVTLELDAAGEPVVVKRFHHGNGLRAALDGRRARREERILLELARLGLSVPRPRALRAGPDGWELHLEPVDGATRLGELLGSGREPPGGWASLVQRLARELARLHAAGWDHGDLHAGNVLVDREGRPWLIDFRRARRHARPSAARELADLVRAAALGREALAPRLRARFFLSWLAALPPALRSPHLDARSSLAAEIELRARAERRRSVRRGLGRWLRESSRVRRLRIAERAALARRDLTDRDLTAEALEGVPGSGRLVLHGRARELEAAWLAAARLREHALPVAAPAVLVSPRGRRGRDGWASFEPPSSGDSSAEALLARLAERGLGLAGAALDSSVARSAQGRYFFVPPFALRELGD